ncbi:hypothetical protein [Flavitalea sp.]|nr:hypothetical protein [Flavitalea sp.]
MFSVLNQSKLHFCIPLFLALLIFTSIKGFAQSIQLPVKGPVPDVADSVSTHYARLVKEFGENKKMPVGLEKQIIYALSYFPELAKTKIKFRLKKSTGGIIATQPTIGSLLRRSSKRTYIVIINDSTEGRRIPLFANCEVNGQVGILGHELCHILYFNNSSGLGLLGLGISHVSKSYMDRFEHNTDSMDIVRGLGYQLIAWNEYLHKGFRAMRANDPPSPEKFVPGKRYMSIEEIRQQMADRKSEEL